MRYGRSVIYVLALLFLFAQQGAIVHGVSHVSDHAKQEQKLPHTQSCDQCIAYAQIGGAVPSGHAIFSSRNEHASFGSGAASTFISLTALAFLSRAPPAIL